MEPKKIMVLAAILLFLIIALQNVRVVTFRILLWEVSMSHVLLLMIVMLIGFAVGLVVRPMIIKRKK
jgi:uncharacterized membrane protein YciS (DUF1049 family)